jgi:uncharacterized membrane protein YkoI
MLRKVLTGTGIAAVLTAMFFVASLAVGPVFAHPQHNTTATQTAVQGPNDDSTEAKVEDADMDQVDEQVGEQNEADEEQPLGEATVTPDGAKAAALTQFRGATITDVQLDNENGSLVYSVELTADGKDYDVKIDAATGTVLRTEADEPDGDNQNAED